MNAKQFAWTYLINNGKAGLAPSYYGGVELTKSGEKSLGKTRWGMSQEDISKIRDDHFKNIRTIGVDWDKTNSPTSDKISSFEGTFADASIHEYLVGSIVLSDGSIQEWYSDPVKVVNVFDAIDLKDEYEEKFHKIFKSVI
jgi:hypothetical protein